MINADENSFIENVEKITSNFTTYTFNAENREPFYPAVWREDVCALKVSGEVSVYVDGVEYSVINGDVIILRPFALYSAVAVGQNLPSVEVVLFNLRGLQYYNDFSVDLKKYQQFLNEDSAVCVVSPLDDWYEEISRLLQDLSAAPSNSACIKTIKSLLETLYIHRNKTPQKNVAREKRRFAAITALDYIRTNYALNFSVKTLAEKCGYSEFYLMKVFKTYTGYSCIDYANNYRLWKSEQLLTETNCAVGKIAREVGFDNASYFNRKFLDLYGVTPSNYRALYFDNRRKK